MNHLRLAAVLGVVLALLPIAPSARADSTICTGVLEAGTYGNIVVPEGATCTLSSGLVTTGNVEVRDGGSLLAPTGGVTVMGDVQSQEAQDVVFGTTLPFNPPSSFTNPSTIEGSAQVSASTGNIFLIRATVRGNIEIRDHQPSGTAFVAIGESHVAGNIEVENNFVGVLALASNDVGGNIELKTNTAAFIEAFMGNTVDGNVEVESNVGHFVSVLFSDVGGNVEFKGNVGVLVSTLRNVMADLPNLGIHEDHPIHPAAIGGNTIHGNLECEENTPDPTNTAPFPPFPTFPNTVGGNKEGQCAGL